MVDSRQMSHKNYGGTDESAKQDGRFQEAFGLLKSKTADGKIVIERVVPKPAGLCFYKKGQASEGATRRWLEILQNISH